jgi:hypothetical protein
MGRPRKPLAEYLRHNEATGCIEWTGAKARGGYGQIKLSGKMVYVHRVFYEFRHGPVPAGKFVCHMCDNPSCCNTDHLFLGTHAENMADKVAKGRAASLKGKYNPAAKLDPESVLMIRELCSLGQSQKDVARQFGVTQANVSLIVTRQKWSHI